MFAYPPQGNKLQVKTCLANKNYLLPATSTETKLPMLEELFIYILTAQSPLAGVFSIVTWQMQEELYTEEKTARFLLLIVDYTAVQPITRVGIYIWQNCSVIIETSNFSTSTADFGGTVRAYVGCIVIISNSVFNDSTAIIDGGVLYVYRGSKVNVRSSKFAFSKARFGAVSLALWNSHVTFENTTFLNNKAEQGGVIGLLEKCSLVILGCNISFSSALSGGVVHTQHSIVIVKESYMQYNNATFFGGVIYANDHSNVSVNSQTMFIHNDAGNGGVITLLEGSFGFIRNALFKANIASESGGDIYLHQAQMTISASTFGLSTAGIYGGSLFASVNTTVYIAESSFVANRAEFGAALAGINSYIFFKSNATQQIPASENNIALLHSNTASKYGGGIYLRESEVSFRLEINIISCNKALSGGGIFADSSSITVNNVHFISNIAEMSGGGLSLSGSNLHDSKDHNTVSDVNFISNIANNGGAIYVNDKSEGEVCNGELSFLSKCFFQNYNGAFMITFYHNIAASKGRNLFGGLLDRCTVMNNSRFDQSGLSTFRSVSNISSLDTISSWPVKVCYCENAVHNCNIQSRSIQVKQRDSFTIQLAAVDQVDRTVSATIQSSLSTKLTKFPEKQATQKIGSNCSDLSYRLISPTNYTENEVIAKFYADGPCGNKSSSTFIVNINIVPCSCAAGFMITDVSTACDCICDRQLTKFINNIQCNSTSNSIIRKGVYWITFIGNNSYSSYVIFPYCPVHYCQSPRNPIPVNLDQSNGSNA